MKNELSSSFAKRANPTGNSPIGQERYGEFISLLHDDLAVVIKRISNTDPALPDLKVLRRLLENIEYVLGPGGG